MQAPDKIYVLYDEDANFLSHTFTNVPCEYGGTKRDIAYIRKDAILEWLNKQLVASTESLRFERNKAFADVIDKINSL